MDKNWTIQTQQDAGENDFVTIKIQWMTLKPLHDVFSQAELDEAMRMDNWSKIATEDDAARVIFFESWWMVLERYQTLIQVVIEVNLNLHNQKSSSMDWRTKFGELDENLPSALKLGEPSLHAKQAMSGKDDYLQQHPKFDG